MNSWWQLADGNYVNPRYCVSLFGSSVGTDFHLNVELPSGSQHQLSGTWSSANEALDAARRLVQGIDPGTYA